MKPTVLTILFSLFVSTQVHAWTVKSTFEDGVLGQRADNKSGATTGADIAHSQTLFSNERPHSGKKSAKATILKGQDGWGEWGLEYNLPGVTQGGEVWFRAWLYHGPEWSYHPDEGGKGLRLQGWDTDGNRNKYYFDTYMNYNRIVLGNGPGTVDGSFVANNGNNIFNYPELRGWECVEMYVKFHSVPGQGIFRAWRNGILWFEDKKTKTLLKANDKGSTTARIFTLFNNIGSQKDQSNFIDDVIITSERPNNTDANGNPYIGVGDITIVAPPLAPGNPR